MSGTGAGFHGGIMKRQSIAHALLIAAVLLTGIVSGLSEPAWAVASAPVYQYFDGSYYYYGSYEWNGTWYPAGWYLSPGTPAPPGYVSPSGWPTGGGAQAPSAVSQTSQAPAAGAGANPPAVSPAPQYTYYDGRYYYYYGYYWNGQWFPTGWYASLGVPAPPGYVSATGWQPGVPVPPFQYYDGSYYYYNPYYWGGMWYPGGWYVGLGIAAPVGYVSPSGWTIGIAAALPLALFFDGYYHYYPRYFWNHRWYPAGWYGRPGFMAPRGYVSPSGWRPGLAPARFGPVSDRRPEFHPVRSFPRGTVRPGIDRSRGGDRGRGDRGRSH